MCQIYYKKKKTRKFTITVVVPDGAGTIFPDITVVDVFISQWNDFRLLLARYLYIKRKLHSTSLTMSSADQPTSSSLNPEPSTSSSSFNVQNSDSKDEESELELEKKMCEAVGAEEFLDKSGVYMLPFQKQIFLDLVYSDALVVCAK